MNKIEENEKKNKVEESKIEEESEIKVSEIKEGSKIKKVNSDKFSDNKDMFIIINYYNKNYFQKLSLSFILNEEEVNVIENGDNNQKMENNLEVYNICDSHIIINQDDLLINQNVMMLFDNPDLLFLLSLEEFKIKRKSTYTILTNIIICIYDLSLKNQITTKIIR
ncbi:hypothetical protein C1645_825175 [Glomus cerebriforme]|uniref:Uncharacterized protein n=1 Tax=Glomus cerebriforme TaxID=658196 RepID=A0A397ST89_9GLOM|nr:hypothetical protein C1645_825175 [Glomus cerebriforme]